MQSMQRASEYLVGFVRRSGNTKTGPIPVSTSPRSSCPDSCPLKGKANAEQGGCFGDNGTPQLRNYWDAVSSGDTERWTSIISWLGLCQAVRDLPEGQPWRHNQVGDLPTPADGDSEAIDGDLLGLLVEANTGRKGWTYTHKIATYRGNAQAISEANANGFTINLSADDLEEADHLAALGIAPVVAVVPSDYPKTGVTPGGRKVLRCPGYATDLQGRDLGITCEKCPLCRRADRSQIIAFPAHSNSKKKLSLRLQVASS